MSATTNAQHQQWKLDPEAVRRRAEGIPGCKEVPCYNNSTSSSTAVAGAGAGAGDKDTTTTAMRHQVSFLVGLEPPESKVAAPTTSATTAAATAMSILASLSSPAAAAAVSAVPDPRNADGLARVTVFADTGTVGVCRVLHNEVRQVFRRNVTTLDAVERMLRHPPPLPVIDKSIVGLDDDDDEAGTGTTGPAAPENNNSLDPIKNRAAYTKMLRNEIELADVGLAILQGEKEKLESHLAATQPLAAGSDRDDKDLQQKDQDISSNHNKNSSINNKNDEESPAAVQPGMEFQFSLPSQAMKHVDQCLNDINKMGKLVRGVATNGKGTVFLYGNGGVAYTPNIPRHLHQKLSQLRNSRMNSRPSYVALGTRDRYFVTFHDGSFSCKGPKGLDRELRKLTKPPASVSFGNSWDTFFIVFADGSWKFQGRTVPDELEEKLVARDDRADIVCCHLGPQGEWYLKARNGRMWWGGITDEADSAILDLLDSGHELNVIDFGEDGSYFVSYD